MLDPVLVLWGLGALAPAVGPVQVEASPPSRQMAHDDPCGIARRIADQRPCVRPEDCAAFQDWRRLFGVPRHELLQPDLAERRVSDAAYRSSKPPQLSPDRLVFPCPAGPNPATESSAPERE